MFHMFSILQEIYILVLAHMIMKVDLIHILLLSASQNLNMNEFLGLTQYSMIESITYLIAV